MRTSPAAIATFLILWKNQKQKRRWASGRPVSSAGGYALHYTGIPPARGREPPLPPHKLREHGVTDYAQVALRASCRKSRLSRKGASNM
jgi:hypothetical protein